MDFRGVTIVKVLPKCLVGSFDIGLAMIHSMLRSDFNKRSKVRPMTTVASKVIP